MSADFHRAANSDFDSTRTPDSSSSVPSIEPAADATPALEILHEPPADWDAFVRETQGATFCHLAGWGRVFREAMGLAPLYIVARQGETLQGVLPVVRMPRLGIGRAMVSMPFLNYGGPLGETSIRQTLIQRVVEEARASGARQVEIRNRTATPSPLSPGREKVTVLLDLPDDPDILFTDRFRSKLRSQIRRPMKEDMEPRFGPEQKNAFYQVFARTMRDLGTPVLSRRFFDQILTTFGDQVDFGAVYHEGLPVAAGCGFHFGDEFEMTWASSLWEFNRMAPNMLLYWSFMERCIERGRKTFNFGRCTPGGGTHRFKSQWGGEDQTLSWIQWPEDAEPDTADSGVFELATTIWSRLPLSLANRLGPVLARRIPTF